MKTSILYSPEVPNNFKIECHSRDNGHWLTPTPTPSNCLSTFCFYGSEGSRLSFVSKISCIRCSLSGYSTSHNSIMFCPYSRLIHVIAQAWIPFHVKTEYIMPHIMIHHILLTHSSSDEYLYYFPFGYCDWCHCEHLPTNNCSSTCYQFLEYLPKSEISRLHEESVFHFPEENPTLWVSFLLMWPNSREKKLPRGEVPCGRVSRGVCWWEWS